MKWFGWFGVAAAFLLGLAQKAKGAASEYVRPTEDPIMPATPAHLKPVRRAQQELSAWQGKVETDPEMEERLRGYWLTALHNRTPEVAFGSGWQSEQPWSAAFISHIVEDELPGALWPAAAHWTYARKALESPRLNAYRALDPSITPVQVGDIIVKNRAGRKYTFADLGRVRHSPSHGDLVVRVQPGVATGIGGNLQHSVREAYYDLDKDGRALDNTVAILRYVRGAV